MGNEELPVQIAGGVEVFPRECEQHAWGCGADRDVRRLIRNQVRLAEEFAFSQ